MYSLDQLKEMFKNCPICGKQQTDGIINFVKRSLCGINDLSGLICFNCPAKVITIFPGMNPGGDNEFIYNCIVFKENYIFSLNYCIVEYSRFKFDYIVNFEINYSYYTYDNLMIKFFNEEIEQKINSVNELNNYISYYITKFKKANLLL